MAKSRVTLKRSEFYKVCKYLEDAKARIYAEKPTMPALAQEAAHALGLTVTENNIRLMIRTMEWKSWLRKESSGTPRRLHLSIVARAVADLYQRMGQPMPAEFEVYLHEIGYLKTEADNANGATQKHEPTIFHAAVAAANK